MPRDQQLQAALEAALSENQRLRDEVQQLRGILLRHSVPLPESEDENPGSAGYPPEVSEVARIIGPADKESKVALFRSLFRGREDVYAERWRMKSGDWGYSPAGRKNWNAVLASRPEDHKKVDRQTRTLYPLTDEAIRLHLSGKKTIGIYPLLLDETC